MYNSRTNPTHPVCDWHFFKYRIRRRKTTKAPPPFSGAGKNKTWLSHCLVLAADLYHSFNRSPFRSYLTTLLTISFVHKPASAPHVQFFRTSTTALFPTHRNSITAYFYQRIVYPKKPRSPFVVVSNSRFRSFRLAD
jgi:hypothetical protein